MQFRIADTFTDSLAKLTGDEQKAVKTTAFDLQMNPAHPSLQFHRIHKAKDPNFWSVRVSRDLRLIVHKTDANLLLCYVDHHDRAYQWAERRKLETHPKTGAAQLVEIRETVREIVVPSYVSEAVPLPKLFADWEAEQLLDLGVPPEWVEEVLAADEESLLALADHLPAEAAEALLEIATGGKPQIAAAVPADADPFAHPDAQRRFRVIDNQEELAQALDYPWEKWTIFLHPTQREVVNRPYQGPTRISGTAGTGKTIVALHRAFYLANTYPEARILLTTFSDALARSLAIKLKRLLSPTPKYGERIDVYAMNAMGERLYKMRHGVPQLATEAQIKDLLQQAGAGNPYSLGFLYTEWTQVVDAWQLESWEAYQKVVRLGRKTRLPERKRKELWEIFAAVRQQLQAQGLITWSLLFSQLAQDMTNQPNPPFDFVVLDEAQDVSVAQLRWLAAMVGDKPDGLFFTGDLGQRIFQQPFSWKSLGVSIQGRSSTLRINYRTSHQIRRQADLLLGPEISDVDGYTENRRGAISVFNGPAPELREFDNPEDEIDFVAKWLRRRLEAGLRPEEIGLFVRSAQEVPRAEQALQQADVSYQVLDHKLQTEEGCASLSTMHIAKGLEFRAVVVMACDDEVIPATERIEQVTDENDLAEVYDTERHLLYVACTRARDYLLVTSGDMPSEFLEDLKEE